MPAAQSARSEAARSLAEARRNKEAADAGVGALTTYASTFATPATLLAATLLAAASAARPLQRSSVALGSCCALSVPA